jgi:hypothetical protein
VNAVAKTWTSLLLVDLHLADDEPACIALLEQLGASADPQPLAGQRYQGIGRTQWVFDEQKPTHERQPEAAGHQNPQYCGGEQRGSAPWSPGDPWVTHHLDLLNNSNCSIRAVRYGLRHTQNAIQFSKLMISILHVVWSTSQQRF